MRCLLLALMAPLLASCAVVEAQNNYRKSEIDYKACVTAQPASPQNCEGYRLAMEADERRYTNIGAAVGGAQSAHNVTIMNR